MCFLALFPHILVVEKLVYKSKKVIIAGGKIKIN